MRSTRRGGSICLSRLFIFKRQIIFTTFPGKQDRLKNEDHRVLRKTTGFRANILGEHPLYGLSLDVESDRDGHMS